MSGSVAALQNAQFCGRRDTLANLRGVQPARMEVSKSALQRPAGPTHTRNFCLVPNVRAW